VYAEKSPGRGARLVALLVMVLFLVTCALPVRAAYPQPAEAQPAVSTRFEGYLKAMGPGKWLVGEITAVVHAQTIVVEKRGRAQVGAWVIVWGEWDEGGNVRADLIVVDRAATRSGPIVQFSGMLRKIASNYWVIEQTLIKVTENTLIRGDPTAGMLVWVVAEQQGDLLVAIDIEVIARKPGRPPVEFEGPIEAWGPKVWQVGGHQVILTEDTLVIGTPASDKNAEVQATVEPDGQLTALLIRVVDPAAEAKLSAMVAAIDEEADGAQTWEVIVFADKLWADPKIGTLRVDGNTMVDESRATAQVGQWAEVRGVGLGPDEYQADVIRLERPVPVNLEGELTAAPVLTGSGSWWQINGQPVWWASPESAKAAVYAGDTVSVIGVRLANGVIWAKQVRQSPGQPR
jgi:hypothetical protein